MIVLAAVVVFWLQPVKLWQENLHPQANREEIEPLLQYLQTHRRPGDAIYVYYFAIDPFKFYYSGPKDDIMWGKSCHDASLPLPPERRQQMERLWMVFSHFETEAFVDSFVAKILGQGWTKQLRAVATRSNIVVLPAALEQNCDRHPGGHSCRTLKISVWSWLARNGLWIMATTPACLSLSISSCPKKPDAIITLT